MLGPPEAAAESAVEPAEPTAAKVGDKRPAPAVDTEELIKKNSQPLVSPPVTTPRYAACSMSLDITCSHVTANHASVDGGPAASSSVATTSGITMLLASLS